MYIYTSMCPEGDYGTLDVHQDTDQAQNRNQRKRLHWKRQQEGGRTVGGMHGLKRILSLCLQVCIYIYCIC